MTKNLTKNLATPTRIALTLVLALALILAFSAPAFADGSSTDVKFKINGGTQISVTLPVDGIVGAVSWADGSIAFPNNTTITNASVFKIYVSQIQCTPSGLWKLGEDSSTESDTIVASIMAGSSSINLNNDEVKSTNGSEWNIGPKNDNDSSDVLGFTLSGNIKNADSLTAGLTTTPTKAFTITFTVAAGDNPTQ